MTDATASPFDGLGARPGASPPPPDDTDDFESPVVQRIVPAASAPSVMPANAFVLPWKSAGSADTSTDQSAAADNLEEKSSMPKKNPGPKARKTKRQPTRGSSARFQICSLLMAKGDLSRDEISADVTADRQAIYNAFYSAKKDGHVVHIASTDKWHLTVAGREWTSGGANLANHKGSMPPPSATKRRKAKTQEAAPAARSPALDATAIALIGGAHAHVMPERSFRCGVFSDGGFHLAKNGQAIDLTAAESKEMLRYLERMAEQPGT